MKKKIGIIIDSTQVTKQIYDLIKLSKKSKNYQISTLLINETSDHNKNIITKTFSKIKNYGLIRYLSSIVFKTICKLESIYLKRLAKYSNFYSKFQLHEDEFEIIKIKPETLKDSLTSEYTKSDLEKIKNAKLDLLISTSIGNLKGEIFTVCPDGIIAIHYSDDEKNQIGPPGFWEVYDRKPLTGFIIQRFKDELGRADILYRGSVATSWFYSLNSANLYEIANPYLHDVIEGITSKKSFLNIQNLQNGTQILVTYPSFIHTIIYLFKTTKILFEKLYIKFSGRCYRWSVAYQFVNTWSEAELNRSTKIPNPQNRFLADPFVIHRNGSHYCFVEDYDLLKKKGSISVYKLSPESSTDLGTALVENFHLSYPYLFEFNDELYMCPETNEKQEIRLYKCIDFPLKWVFHKTLMKDVSASDTSIFAFEDKWWMFTNLDRSSICDHSSQLHLFYGSNPLVDDWMPHINNPVIFNPLTGRNGGLIKDKNSIYRVYQRQGFDFYGEAFGVAKIDKLTTSEYSEKTLFEAEPTFFKGIKGTHTFNFAKGILVLDYVEITKKKTGL